MKRPIVLRGGRLRDPMYPVHLRNHFNSALIEDPRTTNSAEGSHNALRSLLTCSHPTVWKLFDSLRKDIAIQRKVVDDETTGQSKTKKKTYEVLNARVRAAAHEYHNRNDKLKYLRQLAVLQSRSE